MPKYQVPVQWTVNAYYTVEADNEDQIDERMLELLREGEISLSDCSEDTPDLDEFSWCANDAELDDVSVPGQRPRLWNQGDGKIRISCQCGEQLDGVDEIPPGWVDIIRVRSYKESCETAPGVLASRGEDMLDWETHYGMCPECVVEQVRHTRKGESDGKETQEKAEADTQDAG